MKLPDPSFPPLLTGHGVKAPLRPFEEAVRGALEGRYGAGDLIWARALDRVQAALVFEPDVPAEQAREMLFVAMVAAGDAIGALAPPEVAITWDWPKTIRANGAIVGGLELAMAPDKETPPWMVIGLDLALRASGRDVEPGYDLDHTTMYDEGCSELDRTVLLQSWSRHLLAWFDTWQQEGFEPVHQAWMFRATDRGSEIEVARPDGPVRGTFLGLDDHGGLLLKTEDGTILVPVGEAS